MLGLPDGVTACLFDPTGVLTQTAKVHAAAWKQMFDTYLGEWVAASGEDVLPFDPVADYDRYVDGKPRYDGVRLPRLTWHRAARHDDRTAWRPQERDRPGHDPRARR